MEGYELIKKEEDKIREKIIDKIHAKEIIILDMILVLTTLICFLLPRNRIIQQIGFGITEPILIGIILLFISLLFTVNYVSFIKNQDKIDEIVDYVVIDKLLRNKRSCLVIENDKNKKEIVSNLNVVIGNKISEITECEQPPLIIQFEEASNSCKSKSDL